MRNRRVNARKRAMRGRSHNINSSLSTSVNGTPGSIKTLCQHSPQSHFQTPCNPYLQMKLRSSVTEMYLAWLPKTDWRHSGSRGVRAAAQHSMLWGPVTIGRRLHYASSHHILLLFLLRRAFKMWHSIPKPFLYFLIDICKNCSTKYRMASTLFLCSSWQKYWVVCIFVFWRFLEYFSFV